MRPRRLRIKGGTAFVQEADLDFEGLDLFAITGPMGAGKTSLLDAMTIALYGRSPRLGDDLRQVISPLAERAQFCLEFCARGRDYRVTRVLFRNRPTTVALEQRSDDGAWQTLARGVREATAQVERILGLDFDSFTKVVLLPQNEFDAFLRGKPEGRRSILIRLLSLEVYGRIQQRANQVAADARVQADLLTGLLDGTTPMPRPSGSARSATPGPRPRQRWPPPPPGSPPSSAPPRPRSNCERGGTPTGRPPRASPGTREPWARRGTSTRRRRGRWTPCGAPWSAAARSWPRSRTTPTGIYSSPGPKSGPPGWER